METKTSKTYIRVHSVNNNERLSANIKSTL
jgi:hypothetical protein